MWHHGPQFQCAVRGTVISTPTAPATEAEIGLLEVVDQQPGRCQHAAQASAAAGASQQSARAHKQASKTGIPGKESLWMQRMDAKGLTVANFNEKSKPPDSYTE